MKQKNYALKFSLSIVVIVVPIITFLYAILMILFESNISNMLITYFIAISLVFIISLLAGNVLYRFGNVLIDKENCIANQRGVMLRKKDIKFISCYRFIFLYSLNIHSRPFSLFSSLSLYFNNKEELIEFIKNNGFLMEYIREKDKLKLGLGDDNDEQF